MQFPVSQPDDGLIDIAIQEIVRPIVVLAVKPLYHDYYRYPARTC